jgi:hypothetical protein
VIQRVAAAVAADGAEPSRGRAALRRALLERTGVSTPDAFRFHRPRCDRMVATVLARISTAMPSGD